MRWPSTGFAGQAGRGEGQPGGEHCQGRDEGRRDGAPGGAIDAPDHGNPIGARDDEGHADQDDAAVDEVIEPATRQRLETSAERQTNCREGADDRQEEDRERGHDVKRIVHPGCMVAERPELLDPEREELEQAGDEKGADDRPADPRPPDVGRRQERRSGRECIHHEPIIPRAAPATIRAVELIVGLLITLALVWLVCLRRLRRPPSSGGSRRARAWGQDLVRARAKWPVRRLADGHPARRRCHTRLTLELGAVPPQAPGRDKKRPRPALDDWPGALAPGRE